MTVLLAAIVAITALVVTASPSQAVNGSKLQITKIRYDSAGKDYPRSDKKLRDEWVRITNTDDHTRSMTGWTLRDDSRHVYTFPDGYTVKAGENVWVITGPSPNDTGDTAHKLYQDSGNYIWNNTHDRARLRNSLGEGGDTCKWTDSDDSPFYC